MPNIRVTVQNKIATGDGAKIVCGNSDYVVEFVFDAEWLPYTAKTMRVQYTNGTHTDVVFTGNVANLPVIEGCRYVGIGVFAGNLHTSTSATVECEKGIRSAGGAPKPPTPDVYDQLMEKIDKDLAEMRRLTEMNRELTELNMQLYKKGSGE